MIRKFVLIDNKTKLATVFHNTKVVASYEFVPSQPLTALDIETVRTMEYKDKA